LKFALCVIGRMMDKTVMMRIVFAVVRTKRLA
jgi:hypothetical protein